MDIFRLTMLYFKSTVNIIKIPYATSHHQAGKQQLIQPISLIVNFLEQGIEYDQEKEFNRNHLCNFIELHAYTIAGC